MLRHTPTPCLLTAPWLGLHPISLLLTPPPPDTHSLLVLSAAAPSLGPIWVCCAFQEQIGIASNPRALALELRKLKAAM